MFKYQIVFKPALDERFAIYTAGHTDIRKSEFRQLAEFDIMSSLRLNTAKKGKL